MHRHLPTHAAARSIPGGAPSSPRPAIALLAVAPLIGGCHCLDIEILDDDIDDTSRISLYVRVNRCDGEPMATLDESSDFTLSEDGEDLSLFEAGFRVEPGDEAFRIENLLLLDLSGSIVNSGELPTLVSAAREFVDDVSELGPAAVATFDGREDIDVISGFSDEPDERAEALDALEDFEIVDSSTNLYGAVVDGLAILDGEADDWANDDSDDNGHFQGILTTFTDGTHRTGEGGEYSSLWDVRAGVSGTPHSSFTIGLGAEIDEVILGDIGDEGFYWAEDVSQLEDAFAETADRVEAFANSYYKLSYCSPARVGRHTLTLDIDNGNYQGRVAYAFDASGFEGGCTEQDEASDDD